MPRRRGARAPAATPSPSWSRRKMQALLAGVGVLAVLLVVGATGTGLHALHRRAMRPVAAPTATPRADVDETAVPAAGLNPPGSLVTAGGEGVGAMTRSDLAAVTGRRDALAAEPMPEVGDEAAHPAPVSLQDPGPQIVLPPATGRGPAGVPSGFPQTPEGAMAQLAAVDAAVLQAPSLAAARDVAAGWIAERGPTREGWTTMRALGQLFTSAGLSGGGSPRLQVTLTPLMGVIKGRVGTDFVIPCVDFELDVTLAQSERGATADCQRMVWTGGRWMIGAGTEPSPAPAVWPDTDLAISIGYRDVRRG